MTKLYLYFIVFMAFVPLVSSGKIRPRTHRHISELRDISGNLFFTGDAEDDSMVVIRASRPPQDSLKSANRKRIKQVARAKPQSKPEKIGKRDPRDPVGQPEDPGNAPLPPIARPGIRPGGRPEGSRPHPPTPTQPPPRRP